MTTAIFPWPLGSAIMHHWHTQRAAICMPHPAIALRAAGCPHRTQHPDVASLYESKPSSNARQSY